jgi:hypothetical protein
MVQRPEPAHSPVAQEAVHVWKAPLNLAGTLIARLEALLAPSEDEWMQRLRFDCDRRRYTVGRVWLKDVR